MHKGNLTLYLQLSLEYSEDMIDVVMIGNNLEPKHHKLVQSDFRLRPTGMCMLLDFNFFLSLEAFF